MVDLLRRALSRPRHRLVDPRRSERSPCRSISRAPRAREMFERHVGVATNDDQAQRLFVDARADGPLVCGPSARSEALWAGNVPSGGGGREGRARFAPPRRVREKADPRRPDHRPRAGLFRDALPGRSARERPVEVRHCRQSRRRRGRRDPLGRHCAATTRARPSDQIGDPRHQGTAERSRRAAQQRVPGRVLASLRNAASSARSARC